MQKRFCWGKNKTASNDTINMCNQFLVVYLVKKVKSFQARGLFRNGLVYKNAISSIKVYPLPIICKAQLQSLSGIGEYLSDQLQQVIKKHYCAYLDKNMKPFMKQDQQQPNFLNQEDLSVSQFIQNIPQLEKVQILQNDSKSIKSATAEYKPRSNTAAAYFLTVLEEYTERKQLFKATGVSKETLEVEVQTKFPGTKTKQWKCIQSTLSSNGYIVIERVSYQNSKKENVFYKLTEKGEQYAKSLTSKIKQNELKSKIIHQVNSFKSQINSKKHVRALSAQNIPINSQYQPEEEKLTQKLLTLQSYNRAKFFLVIDSRERKEKAESSFFFQKLQKSFKIQCKNTNLSIGDFLWIYDDKVLNYIIQRKKADDLASSILDGRYKDQKYRLKNCGVSNIFYLYEGYPSDNCNKSEKELFNGLLKTRVKEKFKVFKTTDVNESMKLLNTFHEQVYQTVVSSKAKYICSLKQFIQLNSIRRNSTVERIFALGLMTIPGVGKNTINTLTQYFKTYRTMYDYLDRFKKNEEKVEFLKGLFKGTGLISTLPNTLVDLLFSQSYRQKLENNYNETQIQKTISFISEICFEEKQKSVQPFRQQRKDRFSIINEEQQFYSDNQIEEME